MQIETVPGKQFVAGVWSEGAAEAHQRHSPAYAKVVWQGNWSSPSQVASAIEAARGAFSAWAETTLDERIAICQRFADLLKASTDAVAHTIAIETGKPLWEAKTEVAAAVAKVSNSVSAILNRRWTTTQELNGSLAVTRYRPHGVMLVLGPFNLPAHLPGAHMIPALLAGNTIVFKPSELAPATGQQLVALWEQAGVPKGVINLIHGAAEVAKSAVADDRVDGVLFTGSHKVGVALHQQLAGKPHKVLALELGGNNPLVVHNCAHVELAARATILSAFITSGQRCTCARRMIVVGKQLHEQLIGQLKDMLPKIRVGLPLDERQPFIGTLIHATAAERILAAQQQLLETGGQSIVSCQPSRECRAMLTPGLVGLAATHELDDEEHFGPLLTVQCVDEFDEAIQLANQTQFGLSASYFGDRVQDFHYFLHNIRAGIVNWNRQTTGASGQLPFGGVGKSGNHQPSGLFAADYCSYPVATLEAGELNDPSHTTPGLEQL